jgi:hypothetical protein
MFFLQEAYFVYENLLVRLRIITHCVNGIDL